MQLNRLLNTTTIVSSLHVFFWSTTVRAMSTKKVIDSHLHVWADSAESAKFPYADGQNPPESLKDAASYAKLLQHMDDNSIKGSLIVQPINHKFDHSYVSQAIQSHPDRFKGMLLHDPAPSLDAEAAVSKLEDLALQGFVGVRFNPYLWPKNGNGWEYMSTAGGGGQAVYRRCAELHMPVGVMCFQGLEKHYEDIVCLLKDSPSTTLILDHFGFTSLDNDEAFQQLLSLSRYSQVVVKVSALFRLKDESPYERVKTERFEPLLKAFGADRLMFGTDFPFVLEQPPEGYGGMAKLVSSWMKDDNTRTMVMGGTAEKVFGPWGRATG